ncbi:MAG: alkyl sulfatase, partial [Pseudonocardiales bacterium]|nr:alkyl sulfatase [Pseudonocardiales bacterium]
MTVTINQRTPSELTIRPITERIGAEVHGLDLATDLSPSTVASLRDALNQHKALVFRGAELDDEAQQRFAAHFGDLTKAHPTVASVEGAPNILPVDSEQGRANNWHTDVT